MEHQNIISSCYFCLIDHLNIIFLMLYDNIGVNSKLGHDQSRSYVITHTLWISCMNLIRMMKYITGSCYV
jgi:hypothetical protein